MNGDGVMCSFFAMYASDTHTRQTTFRVRRHDGALVKRDASRLGKRRHVAALQM